MAEFSHTFCMCFRQTYGSSRFWFFSYLDFEVLILEFKQGDQGDTLDTGRSSHLYDLMKKGNKAFRDDRYEEVDNHLHGLCYMEIIFWELNSG